MKTYYEIKTISNSVKDVDTTTRRVKVALNKVGVKDHDNDVIAPTAFDKTIKERGPQGKQLIWHLTDHVPSLKSAVGKFSQLGMEGDYLVGVTNIPNTTWGNDVMELYKADHINQHSIGFKTIQEEAKKDSTIGDYNLIKEVMKYEGSAVLWGANEWTPTMSVGKSLTKEERSALALKTFNELQSTRNLIKNAKVTDESFELLYIQEKQLEEKLFHLLSIDGATEPVTTTQPDVIGKAVNVIEQFLKTF